MQMINFLIIFGISVAVANQFCLKKDGHQRVRIYYETEMLRKLDNFILSILEMPAASCSKCLTWNRGK